MLRLCVVTLLLRLALAIEMSHRQSLSPAMIGPAGGRPIEICWGFNESHVEVLLAFPTHGWVAMGLSPDGGMDMSDVLFGYVDDKTQEVVVQFAECRWAERSSSHCLMVHVYDMEQSSSHHDTRSLYRRGLQLNIQEDRWLTANLVTRAVNLSLDAQQDWQMVEGSQNDTHTVIRAARAIKTCDAADRPFKEAVQPVLYSFNFKDPETKTSPIHMHNFRGSVAIGFLAESEVDATAVDKQITKKLSFTVSNVNVTKDMDTVYWCSLMQIPKLDKKYHSIASHPIINPKNMPYIHHMLVYTCDKFPDKYLQNPTFQCAPNQTPFLMQYCNNLIGGWAMGAADMLYLPDGVGQPFTPEMSGMYVAIQMHYNNPERHEFQDDSGMQYLMTDNLRKYDSGTIMTGVLSLEFSLTMPPGQDIFRVRGQCTDQCTSMLPKEGITAFSSGIHMHTRGLSGVVRHYRGSQELPILDINPHYDFNYQTSRPISPPRRILPGDRIVVECNFTTANDIQPIFGGEGSLEEMCLAFISYYPQVPQIKTCGTQYLLNKYLELLSQNRPGMPAFLPHVDADTARAMLTGSLNGPNKMKFVKSLQPALQSYLMSQKYDAQKAAVFEDFYMNGVNYVGVCIGKGNVTKDLNDHPPAFKPFMGADPSSNC